jgi:hypothetical protein
VGVDLQDRDRQPGNTDRRVKQAAAAEVNGRRVNEAIECGNLGCNATVELTIPAYERVRSGFDCFLVVPGHELPDIERVAERHEDYLVVTKEDGQAVLIAAVTDERSTG